MQTAFTWPDDDASLPRPPASPSPALRLLRWPEPEGRARDSDLPPELVEALARSLGEMLAEQYRADAARMDASSAGDDQCSGSISKVDGE